MSELSFEQMLDESFKTIRNGEVVEGTSDTKPTEFLPRASIPMTRALTSRQLQNLVIRWRLRS